MKEKKAILINSKNFIKEQISITLKEIYHNYFFTFFSLSLRLEEREQE